MCQDLTKILCRGDWFRHLRSNSTEVEIITLNHPPLLVIARAMSLCAASDYTGITKKNGSVAGGQARVYIGGDLQRPPEETEEMEERR
jgi:hypothetical protein